MPPPQLRRGGQLLSGLSRTSLLLGFFLIGRFRPGPQAKGNRAVLCPLPP